MAFSITLLNKNYTIEEFVQIETNDLPNWVQETQKFLISWQKGKDTFTQKTSGSTGSAKEIHVSRKSMEISALNTIIGLKIPNGASVLHCLNSAFIGGKMMLVRAIIGEWKLHLLQPKSTYAKDELWPQYNFAAMVPLQVSGILDEKDGDAVLNSIHKIIIGGAPPSEELIGQLASIKSKCFSTFGMTETVSHIALKGLNGPDRSDEYKVIGDNIISTNSKGCMMIKGKVTADQWLETNDLIQVTKTGFKWLGRFDMVVNTGGVKVLIEPTEEKLASLIKIDGHQFLLWKKTDEKLGEKLIGLSDSASLIEFIGKHQEILKKGLPAYHFPSEWFLTKEIVETESGKVDRPRTAENILKEISFE